MAIFDTHVSLKPLRAVEFEGRRYWGLEYREHRENATAREKSSDVLSSIDNTRSFWLTRGSLCDLLQHVGFTSVYECQNPAFPVEWIDRPTCVAIKGRRIKVLSSPVTDRLPQIERPRKPPHEAHPVQSPFGHLINRLKAVLPQPLKNFLKSLRARV